MREKESMLEIVTPALEWFIGIIVLVLCIALLNLLVRFIRQLTNDIRRIEILVLVCPRDAISKYAYEAIRASSWGITRVESRYAIARLFPGFLSDAALEKYARAGKIFSLLQLSPTAMLSRQEAVKMAMEEISRSQLALNRLVKYKTYAITSKVTDASLQAYLIIIGHISSLPPFVSIETLN